MNSTTELQSYVNGVLRLQDKYGWMMDSYVLDFFTDNLWERLPRKWSDILVPLQPEEIGYFLLEIYSPLKSKRQDKGKPKFRKVWPLELLAFLASCHALKLCNQVWVEKFNDAQNTILNNTVPKDTEPNQMKTVDGKSTLHRCSNTKNDSELNKRSESTDTQLPSIKDAQKDQRFLQGLNLSHPFRRHIKPKKLYEIDVLSKIICEQTEKLQCWNIVDVGAGLGHLSRWLSYGYKLRVVTIEGDGCHQSGAEKIDAKVLAHLQKQESMKKVDGTTDRFLVHITHHISADISAQDFSNVVSEALTKMRKNTGVSQGTANLSENFIIVGLHTCGDLASTLVRVFSQCANAVGIISVGCCYMKLSHKTARTHQGTESQRVMELSEMGIELTNCNKQNAVECTEPTSRQSSTNISGGFEQKKIKNTDTNDTQASTRLGSDEKVLGYPMSDYVQSLPNHRQTYNALESACHAIERYHKKLIEISSTLKLHYYRALLELLLKQKDPDSPRRQIRRLRTKKSAKMSFFEYVTSACDILGIEEGRPTAQDIRVAEELHGGKEFNVVVFYVLRLLMAPVIEGLLLVDRYMFIKEKNPDINTRISMLFDPDLSPRNYAIIADKIS